MKLNYLDIDQMSFLTPSNHIFDLCFFDKSRICMYVSLKKNTFDKLVTNFEIAAAKSFN